MALHRLPVYDVFAGRQHGGHRVGRRHTAVAVELALVLLHVVEQVALQILAPQHWLSHGLAPGRLDALDGLPLGGAQLLAPGQRIERLPVALSLPPVVRHRARAHVRTDPGAALMLRPGGVVAHALQAELDHLTGLDHIAVALGSARLAATTSPEQHRPARREAGHAVGQLCERPGAVLAHSSLADHERPGVQRARHRVLVARARHRTAGHAREGGRNWSPLRKLPHATTDHPSQGVRLYPAHGNRVGG